MAVWNVLEIVDLNGDHFYNEGSAPLQLLKINGKKAADQKPLWFVGGVGGGAKLDAMLIQLLQKALQSGIFTAAPDIYMTPVLNPVAQGDVRTEAMNATLLRWAEFIDPKSVISFTSGPELIRQVNTPKDVYEKLATITERIVYDIGAEPEVLADDGNPIPYTKIENVLKSWVSEKEVSWIDFTLPKAKRSFDELRDLDWKVKLGPALRWLVEDLRFNPVQLPPPVSHTIIPALELPPEFANL